MRAIALLLLCAAACSPARARRTVSPTALQGITLGVPPVPDLRPTPGIGCGQIAQDLTLRAHKQLVQAFADAGAQVSLSDRVPWTATVILREAGMGLENAGRRRTDRPLEEMPPDQPSIAEPRASLFNSGNENAAVVLELTLAHAGVLLLRTTVTGHAESGPCLEAVGKVREALGEAVDEVRERTITGIAATAP